jgi:hypothetical protein
VAATGLLSWLVWQQVERHRQPDIVQRQSEADIRPGADLERQRLEQAASEARRQGEADRAAPEQANASRTAGELVNADVQRQKPVAETRRDLALLPAYSEQAKPLRTQQVVTESEARHQTEAEPGMQRAAEEQATPRERAGVEPVQPTGDRVMVRQEANVRAAPNQDAPVQRTAPGGTLLRVYSRSGNGWVQVGDDRPWGWIFSGLLEPQHPATQRIEPARPTGDRVIVRQEANVRAAPNQDAPVQRTAPEGIALHVYFDRVRLYALHQQFLYWNLPLSNTTARNKCVYYLI